LTYVATTGVLTAAGFVGPLTGNASTATSLATARAIGGVNFDGTAAITPTTIVVADTDDTTSYVGLWTGTTGSLLPKTDGEITYNATTDMLTVANLTVSTGPTADTHAATKLYVDNAIAGLAWKDTVRVATIADGALATEYENGDTIDTIVLATGDRILIKDQTAGAENGIYVVQASGAPTRATDADADPAGQMEHAAMFVDEGNANGNQAWLCNNNGAITVGTTALTFVQFAGSALYSGGDSITISSNSINVDDDFLLNTGDSITGTLTLDGVATDITTDTNEDLAIMPNGSGKVGIGITDPTDTLHVVGNVLATTGVHIGANADASTLIDDASNVENGSATLYIGDESILASGDLGGTVQAYDAGLTSIAGLTTLADRMIYTTASDVYAVTTLTAQGRAILDDASAAAQQATIGLGTWAGTTNITTLGTITTGSWGTALTITGGDASIDATQKINLEGAAGDTYIQRASAGVVVITVDGIDVGEFVTK
ncbi:MAG: hypothetical protein QF535_12920, partial [Anaerolineales bacterium]|nr:hypothetical protein [Anaerolineales bacterium]